MTYPRFCYKYFLLTEFHTVSYRVTKFFSSKSYVPSTKCTGHKLKQKNRVPNLWYRPRKQFGKIYNISLGSNKGDRFRFKQTL